MLRRLRVGIQKPRLLQRGTGRTPAFRFYTVDCFHDNLGGVLRGKNRIAVLEAEGQRQAEILKAEAYMAQQKPESIAAASERVAAARSYSYSTRTVAAAEAERFRTQLNTYLVMPEMFKLRTYLDFLEKDCRSMRKFIVSSDLGSEILQFNLEVKERLDLVDTDITKLTYN